MQPETLHAITPVILCGGSGKRLRPLSRLSKPKPFIRVGAHTMLQHTVLRIKDCGPPVLSLNHAMEDRARQDLLAIGSASAKFILEPEGRNTMPALAAAASLFPSGLLLVLPVDHWIELPSVFLLAVSRAAMLAEEGWIVAFGIPPERPDSGFGYIRRGLAIRGDARRVECFCEKPERNAARSMIDSGNWDWNSGIYLLRADIAQAELQRFEPGLLSTVQESLPDSHQLQDRILLGPAFSRAPALSIDKAIMERSDKILVMPMGCGWDDLGSWVGLLRRFHPKRLRNHPFFV